MLIVVLNKDEDDEGGPSASSGQAGQSGTDDDAAGSGEASTTGGSGGSDDQSAVAANLVGKWQVVGVLESYEGDPLKKQDGTAINPGDEVFTDSWTLPGSPFCLDNGCVASVYNDNNQFIELELKDGYWTGEIQVQYGCEDGTTATATGTVKVGASTESTMSGTRELSSPDLCGMPMSETDTLTLTLTKM